MRYLDALESADRGDLSPLVAVFAESQRRALVQALGVAAQVLRLNQAEQIVRATRDQLQERERRRRAEWDTARATASHLQSVAAARLHVVSSSLEEETSAFFERAQFYVDSEPTGGGRGHYFRWQIIETAKQLDYFANLSEHRTWIRLVLRTDSQAEILISFHGTGHAFRGILAVSACFFRRDQTDERESEVADLTSLSGEIFQVNYRESQDEAEARFGPWLEDILVKGLDIWRAGL
jgi:hypothetical protein